MRIGGFMASQIDDLLERIAALEREADNELDGLRTRWRYRIEKGRARFERDVREAHERLRQNLLRYVRESQILKLDGLLFVRSVPNTSRVNHDRDA
jgi:hypothetical protein